MCAVLRSTTRPGPSMFQGSHRDDVCRAPRGGSTSDLHHGGQCASPLHAREIYSETGLSLLKQYRAFRSDPAVVDTRFRAKVVAVVPRGE